MAINWEILESLWVTSLCELMGYKKRIGLETTVTAGGPILWKYKTVVNLWRVGNYKYHFQNCIWLSIFVINLEQISGIFKGW